MKRNKRSTNKIPSSKEFKHNLLRLDKVNPSADYNGGFENYEDPYDYYSKTIKLSGTRLA